MSDSVTRAEPSSVFPQTRWSLVLQACNKADESGVRRALEELCTTYWMPLYAVGRQRGFTPEETQDLVQGFFEVFLAGKYVERADPEAGRLRWFLLAGFRNHLSNVRRREAAEKRGGGQAVIPLDTALAERRYGALPADTMSPEVLYDRHWAMAVIDRAMESLRKEQEARGKGTIFATLRALVMQDEQAMNYASLAVLLGTTEAAIKMQVKRLKERLRDLIRSTVAETVAAGDDVDDEVRALFRVFG